MISWFVSGTEENCSTIIQVTFNRTISVVNRRTSLKVLYGFLIVKPYLMYNKTINLNDSK